MKPLYRNILLLVGIAALVITAFMVEIPESINWGLAAVYLPAVILIYGVVYSLNAIAFQQITNTVSEGQHLSFLKSFKLTMSAFALTFITPFGFGGGPYRVMELSRYIGTPRAISSVTLYSLMHIMGHFLQWFTCIVLFVVIYTERMNPFFWVLFGAFLAVFLLVVVVFNWFYTNGLLERLFKLFFFVPGLRGWARRFHGSHQEAFVLADENVMYLKKNPKAFWSSLLCEYFSRLVNATEFFFILAAFGMSDLHYYDMLLIVGFASFLGNVLYILPLQIGAREGGLAIILRIIYGVAGNVGFFVSFYTRVREIFWVAVGILLIKVGNNNLMRSAES